MEEWVLIFHFQVEKISLWGRSQAQELGEHQLPFMCSEEALVVSPPTPGSPAYSSLKGATRRLSGCFSVWLH